MKRVLIIVATLSMLMIPGLVASNAQVTDALVADIPFDFQVQNTTLPAGRYTIRRLDSVSEEVMKITSAENKKTVVFLTTTAQLNKAPHQGELIFDRVGDEYFLSQLFNQENPLGAAVQKSRAERRLEREGAQLERSTVTIPALDAINARR